MSDQGTTDEALWGKSDNAQRYKRSFWQTENRRYAVPHYRLNKVARVTRTLAGASDCDLLDLGCGPGTLGHLLPDNVHYHGIDIAIQEPAANLVEMDLLDTPISFRGKMFDLVVAQGLFEYLADRQRQKFAEIRSILKPTGRFFVTYTNFAHRRINLYHAYSNAQHPADFRRDLEYYFTIERFFPGAYNWNHTLPNRSLIKKIQNHLEFKVPLVSQPLAVDYFYICSPRPQEGR